MAGDGESGKGRKVRAIGLSNFYPDRFVDMAECAEIKPAVNQLKTNVFSQQWDAEAEMKPYDTRIMLGPHWPQGDPDLLTNPILTLWPNDTINGTASRPSVTWCNAASSPSRKARISSE